MCFSAGLPSAKRVENILDSSDATKCPFPLLTSVCHHLRLFDYVFWKWAIPEKNQTGRDIGIP